ncbi:MAG: hypothetical protein ABSE46_22665 [Terracidiphilus sp.]
MTQLTSSSGGAISAAPSLEYIHHSIDSIEIKYKNRNFLLPRKPATLPPTAASKKRRSIYSSTEGAEGEILNQMASPLEPESLSTSQEAAGARGDWFKLGALAAVSVLAGGLAAAWWYRSTLKKLHQAEEAGPNPQSGFSGDDSAE